jgi:hypothetical protein
MNNEVFELFFAMLSLGTLGFGLVVLFARVFKAKKFLVEVQKIALPLAALITTTAMFGSLYFSEIVNYVPCAGTSAQRCIRWRFCLWLQTLKNLSS